MDQEAREGRDSRRGAAWRAASLAAVLSVSASPAMVQAKSPEWCEQHWRTDSAEAVPDGSTATAVLSVDSAELLKKWQARAGDCAGTVVYEARLAIANLLARQPDKAREVLKPLVHVRSDYAYLVEFAALLSDYIPVMQGKPTLEDVRRNEEKLRTYVKKYPSFGDAYCLLGGLQSLLGKHAEAIESLEIGLRSSMDLSGAYRNLTVSYSAAGRYRDAIHAGDEAYRLDRSVTSDPYFVFALARAEAGMGDFDGAETALRVIASKKPEVRSNPEFKETVDFVLSRMSKSKTAQCEQVLRALRTRRRGAFVVLADRNSKKYVQFAGSSQEPLLLDLPTQALSADELKRAVRLFEELGVRLATWKVEEAGGRGREQSAFQMELGADAPRAAETAMRVFREVYRLSPEFKLEITEG